MNDDSKVGPARGLFGPQSPDEEPIYAEEAFLADVQELICESLHEKGWTREQLAEALGVNPPSVVRMLSGEDALTLRIVARIFFALGKQCEITTAAIQPSDDEGTEP